jgi:hypothetical protein
MTPHNYTNFTQTIVALNIEIGTSIENNMDTDKRPF